MQMVMKTDIANMKME